MFFYSPVCIVHSVMQISSFDDVSYRTEKSVELQLQQSISLSKVM